MNIVEDTCMHWDNLAISTNWKVKWVGVIQPTSQKYIRFEGGNEVPVGLPVQTAVQANK